MRLSWRGRQVAALLLLAVVLFAVAGFIELVAGVRQAIRQAEVEADLVAASIRREIVQIVQESHADPLFAIAENPRLAEALRDAIVMAPSILSASVLDPDGAAVAHTQTSRVGQIEPPYPPLPTLNSPLDAIGILWRLRHGPPAYQKEVTLEIGDRPLAVVRVAPGGTFLRDAVGAAASRGIWMALAVIAIAVGAGVLLGRFAAVQIRALERGIEAIHEGRFEKLPESGIDAFARLAHAVNLLGARFASESDQQGARGEPGGAGDHSLFEGRSRAVAHLGEIAAGVAHEMRNQLQAVEGEIDGLRAASALPPEIVREKAQNAARGLERMNGAVRGFLKIARLQPPTLRPLDVNGFLRAIEEEFRAEVAMGGASLRLELDPGEPVATADPEVLRQAMQNLIRNSLQALIDSESGEIVLRSARGEDYVEIMVRDNGPGIPSEVREKMFDLFYTTRSDGSGVGLVIVRQSIEMHAGHVDIRSTPGQGTEIVMELPCA